MVCPQHAAGKVCLKRERGYPFWELLDGEEDTPLPTRNASCRAALSPLLLLSSSASWGARACSNFDTFSSFPGRRFGHALMYNAFEERSISFRRSFANNTVSKDNLGLHQAPAVCSLRPS